MSIEGHGKSCSVPASYWRFVHTQYCRSALQNYSQLTTAEKSITPLLGWSHLWATIKISLFSAWIYGVVIGLLWFGHCRANLECDPWALGSSMWCFLDLHALVNISHWAFFQFVCKPFGLTTRSYVEGVNTKGIEWWHRPLGGVHVLCALLETAYILEAP